jgi:hypothetical protein
MNDDAALAIDVLSENGCHFLRSTLDEVGKDDQAGNRNAVIFAAAALEVLLKTRLAIEHWTLLFEDPAKAKLSELKGGEFVSVSASKLVQRLNNVVSLNLKNEAPDKVFKLRNRVVHFAPPTDLAVRVEVALGLNFALAFIHEHLLPHFEPRGNADLAALKEEIADVFRELEHFRTSRLESLEGALGTHPIVVECPDCNQATLVVQGDEDADSCLFCLATTEGEELAQRYVADVLNWSWRDEADGGEDPIQACINCDADAFVTGIQVVNRPKIAFGCFSCAEVFEQEEVQRCDRCGDLMAADEENGTCSACWSAIL